MKKSLLLASMAFTALTSVMAKTDGNPYLSVNGLTCQNKWIASRNDNLEAWNALPFANQFAKARTACIGQYNGKDAIIVGFSETIVVGEDSNDYAHLVIIDFATGEVIKTVQMTADGQPINGLLCANQVGCDQFGHVWFANYVATVYNAETGAFTPLNIYVVDDLDAGTCHKAAALTLPADETDFVGRIDYCNLVGDITRQEAGCIVMTALNGGETTVLGWGAEQGSDKWEGALDGYTSAVLSETYPAEQTNWGSAPMVRIVRDDEFSNKLFYVDGYTTCPSLYSNNGSMIDSFGAASFLEPKVGTNGLCEFTLSGHKFMAYSVAQYDTGDDPGCQVNIVELGKNRNFKDMQLYWSVPANGLGQTSDSGTRIHSVDSKAYTNADGKDATYLLTYKCNNGIGLYAIGEKGSVDPIGDDPDIDSGVYFGITAFNHLPKFYNIDLLDKSNKQKYFNFVNSQKLDDYTYLYYSVDKAIDVLTERTYPKDLSSVALITFTDGNDDGSLEVAPNTSWTDIDYQKYVGEKIRNTTLQGHQLEAFSIGLKGKDIGDYNYDLFKSNLLALASDDNNASEVTNMSEVERALNRIIDHLQNTWFTKHVSVKINMRGTGDRIRFTLDKSRVQMNNNPENSDLWVEGIFSRDDLSLNGVEYHGFTSTSGEKLIAMPVTVNGKTKYQFTFEDLRDKDGNPLETGEINFWHKNAATPAWQPHTEFGGAGDVETETEYTSAAVMLVMDCSTSLGEADFAKLKNVVNSVIERLAERKSGVDDIVVDEAEDAPVEYYNLQGLRVMNPTHGIYIQRQGNKAKKIYVR